MKERARLLAPLALSLLLCAPFLTGHELLVGRDLLVFGYPHAEALGQAFRAGRLPLWDPSAFHGEPWLGPRAGGVCYPPNLLFALASAGRTLPFFLALHLAWACWGARALAGLGCGGRAAWAAGFAYGCGGFLSSLTWNPVYVISGAWLPWAAWGGARLGRDPVRGVLAGGGALGACLLASEPQGALLCAGLFSAAALLTREQGARGWRRALGGSAAGGALGLALGGVALAGTLAALPELDRWQLQGSGAFGLAPRALLLDLALPGVLGEASLGEGGYWAGPLWGSAQRPSLPWCALAVGSLGGALLLAALAGAGSGLSRAALGLVAAGLLLCGLDAGAPLGLRYPAKFLALSALGLALGVGRGFQLLFAAGARPALGRRVGRWLLLGALLAGLAGLLLPESLGARLAADAGEGVLPARAARSVRWALLRAALGWALLGGLLLRGLARIGRRRAAAWALALLAGELCGLASARWERDRPELLQPPDSLPAALRAAEPFARTHTLAGTHAWLEQAPLPSPAQEARGPLLRRAYRDAFHPNQGAPLGIRSVWAFGSVRRAAFASLVDDPRFRAAPRSRQVELLNAEWALWPARDLLVAPAERARFEVIGAARPGLRWVRYPGVAPWVGLRALEEVRLASTREDAREQLFAGGRLVIGPEGRGAFVQGQGQAAPVQGALRLRQRRPEALRFALELRGPCVLLLHEAFDPGWRAWVDGEERPLARANLLYRALPLRGEERELRLVYRPPGWPAGPLLSLCGALCAAGLAAWSWRRSASSCSRS